MHWQVHSTAKLEVQGARKWHSLLYPNRSLSIRTRVQGWGDQIWQASVRIQAHQLQLMGCHWGDIPLSTESDSAESKSCPSGDFKGPHFLLDAIAFIRSWKCEMQQGSTSSLEFSAWLCQWFAGCPWKSQLSFCCLRFLSCTIESCSQA